MVCQTIDAPQVPEAHPETATIWSGLSAAGVEHVYRAHRCAAGWPLTGITALEHSKPVAHPPALLELKEHDTTWFAASR
jgi:hypothetical protein